MRFWWSHLTPRTYRHTERAGSKLRSLERLESRLCLAAAIGDRVWSDINGDGLQSSGEPGIPGIQLQLFAEGQQTPVQTTSTNAKGYYRFNRVDPGRYTIEVMPPSRWTVSPQHMGSIQGNDSDADANGTIGPFDVAADTLNMDFDAGLLNDGFVAKAFVGSRVWNDNNGNGVQDYGEPGVEGVRVQLLAEGGTRVLRTVRTNAGGGFSFRDVVPGSYVMRVQPPADWSFTSPHQGGREGLDSDADASGFIGPFTLEEGQMDVDWDAGLLEPDYVDQAMIGDRVWHDVDGDGRQNTGEPAVAGVTLTLFEAGSTTPLTTTSTGDSGRYRFKDLAPGSYDIQVVPPTGWTFTIPEQGGRRGGDSDVDAQGMMGPISVAAGQLAFDWDVGLRAPGSDPPTGLLPVTRIGDAIWHDLNGDGLHGSREPGLPNVLVRLWRDGSNTPVDTTMTNADGHYHFNPSMPGDYTLQVVPPVGWSFTNPHQGYSQSIDSKADAAGLIGPFSVEIGQHNSDVDAGLLPPGFEPTGHLEGFVWIDEDGNHTLGVGDRRASGTEIRLYDASSTQPIRTTTIDAQGNYRFRDLEPGTYSVEVVAPANWAFALPDVGWSRSRNSDADQDGIIGPFSLSAGEFKSDLDALLQRPNLVRPVEIGNRVWNDLNGDGRQGAGEPGVAGVEVRLFEAGATTPMITSTTDQRGIYVYNSIDPGTYFVDVVPPAGWSFTTLRQGGGRSVDSDANANGRLGPIVLSEGESQWDWDAGMIAPDFAAPARIGNRVWNDVNGNGIQDPQEPGIPGIEVHLLAMGVNGPWQTRKTDADGLFTFRDLAPNTYQLQIIPGDEWSLTLPDQGNDDTRDSDADPSGLTPPITVAAGDVALQWDAGLRVDPGYLANLTIQGTELELAPAFSPTISRYSIRTGPGSSAVSLTLFAGEANDQLTVNGLPATSGVPIALPNLTPGDTVQIETRNPSAPSQPARQYELILLPDNFPRLEVTTLEDGVSDGVTYLSLRKPGNQAPFFITIVDNHGVSTFFRETPRQTRDFKLHPNGMRSYAEFTGTSNAFGRSDTERVILDPSFQEIGRFQVVGDLNHTDFHEFLILPNGNYVFISYNGEVRNGMTFEDSVIQVVDPQTMQEVFRWNSKDEIPLSDVLRTNMQEYAHINSVFVDHDGHLLASLRGTSQIVKINSNTGRIIWKLGGLSSDFSINDPKGGICGQHTASRLANGHLLAFDNGIHCPPTPEYADRINLTRVVEYRLDESAMTADLVWSYTFPGFYTRSTGSSQRLENGNTMIGWGNGPYSLASEVTDSGEVVFEIIARGGGQNLASYRAVRFAE